MITHIYGLYALDNPDHIRYVGKTIDVNQRMMRHQYDAKQKSSHDPIHRWIRKHQQIGTKILESIDTNEPDAWVEVEQQWIDKLRAEGHKLLNLIPSHAGGPKGLQKYRIESSSDYIIDTQRKSGGRVAWGEKNGLAKLTDEIVIAARKMKKNGMSFQEIKEHLELDITITSLDEAVTGRTWTHLDETPAAREGQGSGGGSHRRGMTYELAEQMRAEAKVLEAEGTLNKNALGRKYGLVSPNAVHNLLNRKTYKKP